MSAESTSTSSHLRSELTLLLPLFICSFGVTVTNSMIFPALSDLQDKYHFADSGLGFISAAGFLSSLVVQLAIAPLADRGHPKRVIMLGLMFASAGSMTFAFGGSLPVFIFARILSGTASGLATPALRAIVANLDRTKAAERLGRLRGVELSGYTGGPLIGALLIGPFGLRGAFIIFGALGLVTIAIMVPRHLPTLATTAQSRKISLELLRFKPVRAAVLASLTLFIPVGVYDSLWDRYVTDRGGNNFMVGLTFLLYTIPFSLLAPRGGRLADKRGSSTTVVWGIMLTVPIVFIYGLLTTAWLLVGFAVVEGIAGAIASPSAVSLMAHVAPDGRASAAQGLMSSGDLLAGSIMALIAPTLYGHYGPATTFGFAAALVAICGTAVALMLRTTADSRSSK
jgi:MFS family permease